jgi:hypothetical protein
MISFSLFIESLALDKSILPAKIVPSYKFFFVFIECRLDADEATNICLDDGLSEANIAFADLRVSDLFVLVAY